MPSKTANPIAIAIAIMAKAPIPGLVKTRLIPSIGAHGAAVLQERLTARAVATALAADIGPVTVWCAPDPSHAAFRELIGHYKVALKRQRGDDLGARMLTAMTGAGPTLLIGTDCPAMTPTHLRGAANALHCGAEVVTTPAEDGGYVLIGAQKAHAELFSDMVWSAVTVMAETRARIAALGLRSAEMPTLWDVDIENDLARLEREIPGLTL